MKKVFLCVATLLLMSQISCKKNSASNNPTGASRTAIFQNTIWGGTFSYSCVAFSYIYCTDSLVVTLLNNGAQNTATVQWADGSYANGIGTWGLNDPVSISNNDTLTINFDPNKSTPTKYSYDFTYYPMTLVAKNLAAWGAKIDTLYIDDSPDMAGNITSTSDFLIRKK